MNPNLEFNLVDAFAHSPGGGNVAGVVFDADRLTDRQMQIIAAEFNASETTFVLKPDAAGADVRFRWFTPSVEVNFCGHATIGAVHALRETNRLAEPVAAGAQALRVSGRCGVLPIRIEPHVERTRPAMIWLDIPKSEPKQADVDVGLVCKYLGITPDALDPRIRPIRTHDDDVILAVTHLPVLLELAPPMADLARYCRKSGLRGILVTTTNVPTAATVVQSRFFAPAAGIDEDPVTGSAHGPLGLHLVNSGVVELKGGRADFQCLQAKAGGRAGLVRVLVVEATPGQRKVTIGGTCVTTASGALVQLPIG